MTDEQNTGRKVVQHGRVTVEVPEDWVDESTVRFATPVQSTTKKTSFRSTLSISLEPVHDAGATSRDVLEKLGQVLRESGVRCEDVSWSDGRIGDHEAKIVEREVTMMGGAKAHQVMAAAIVGDEALIVTAASSEKRWQAEHEELEALLAGVRFRG